MLCCTFGKNKIVNGCGQGLKRCTKMLRFIKQPSNIKVGTPFSLFIHELVISSDGYKMTPAFKYPSKTLCDFFLIHYAYVEPCIPVYMSCLDKDH